MFTERTDEVYVTAPGNRRDERIDRGQCVRCRKPAADGSEFCERHHEDAKRRSARSMSRLRARRRAAEQCAYCGKPSKTRRCRQCSQREGLTRVNIDHRPSSPTFGPRRPVERKWVTETDGKRRQRFAGRGRRGQPSRQQMDSWDLRTLATEHELLLADHEAYFGDDNQARPRIQRDAALRSALGHLELLLRTGLDLADRWRKWLK